MTILSLWQNNKFAIEDKTIEQILSFCGNGKLLDGNPTSIEFRQFISNIPLKSLQKYAEECLISSFTNSGLILQDIVNQIGFRLGYRVEPGFYRGRRNEIGFDGIWTANNGHQIIVEVKTTDAYRINLDTIAGYRESLVEQGKIKVSHSSILIIVGRQDTGDLEAQIRGSKHAWDIRLISTDALLKLATLKENLNDAKTFQQINKMLKPMEYTKVDPLIDIIFHTTEDLQLDNVLDDDIDDEDNLKDNKENQKSKGSDAHRSSYHELCIEKVEKKLNSPLIKQARSLYMSPDNKYRISCAVSKKYKLKDSYRFWYAFHPSQKEFLEEVETAYLTFGCGSEKKVLCIPFNKFSPLIDHLGKTDTGKKMYWHVEIYEKDGEFTIRQNYHENFIVTKYLI
jgi:hypothetical protein